MSMQARKIACLFGTGWGFKAAAQHVNDVCGWKISGNRLKDCCYTQAAHVSQWRQQDEGSCGFQEAQGEVEFLVDGTMVNTVEEGWKEIRVGVFLKRPTAAPVRAHEWATRSLEEPTARSARVVMQSSEAFGACWRRWASLLGITSTSQITVIADGAKWIWREAEKQFPDAQGVLDVYHVLEHLADATNAVHGEGSGASRGWKDAALRALLRDGWHGLFPWIGRWRQFSEQPEQLVVTASENLTAYLLEHTNHLGYCQRLAKGQSIGSGVIEGACKYVVGRRLKRTGSRWKAKNAVLMGTLCSTHYVGDWDHYWKTTQSITA